MESEDFDDDEDITENLSMSTIISNQRQQLNSFQTLIDQYYKLQNKFNEKYLQDRPTGEELDENLNVQAFVQETLKFKDETFQKFTPLNRLFTIKILAEVLQKSMGNVVNVKDTLIEFKDPKDIHSKMKNMKNEQKTHTLYQNKLKDKLTRLQAYISSQDKMTKHFSDKGCQHFLNDEQMTEKQRIKQQKQLRENEPLFKQIEKQMAIIKSQQEEIEQLQEILKFRANLKAKLQDIRQENQQLLDNNETQKQLIKVLESQNEVYKSKVEYQFENNIYEKTLGFKPTSKVTKENLQMHIESNYLKQQLETVKQEKDKERDDMFEELTTKYERKIQEQQILYDSQMHTNKERLRQIQELQESVNQKDTTILSLENQIKQFQSDVKHLDQQIKNRDIKLDFYQSINSVKTKMNMTNFQIETALQQQLILMEEEVKIRKRIIFEMANQNEKDNKPKELEKIQKNNQIKDVAKQLGNRKEFSEDQVLKKFTTLKPSRKSDSLSNAKELIKKVNQKKESVDQSDKEPQIIIEKKKFNSKMLEKTGLSTLVQSGIEKRQNKIDQKNLKDKKADEQEFMNKLEIKDQNDFKNMHYSDKDKVMDKYHEKKKKIKVNLFNQQSSEKLLELDQSQSPGLKSAINYNADYSKEKFTDTDQNFTDSLQKSDEDINTYEYVQLSESVKNDQEKFSRNNITPDDCNSKEKIQKSDLNHDNHQDLQKSQSKCDQQQQQLINENSQSKSLKQVYDQSHSQQQENNNHDKQQDQVEISRINELQDSMINNEIQDTKKKQKKKKKKGKSRTSFTASESDSNNQNELKNSDSNSKQSLGKSQQSSKLQKNRKSSISKNDQQLKNEKESQNMLIINNEEQKNDNQRKQTDDFIKIQDQFEIRDQMRSDKHPIMKQVIDSDKIQKEIKIQQYDSADEEKYIQRYKNQLSNLELYKQNQPLIQEQDDEHQNLDYTQNQDQKISQKHLDNSKKNLENQNLMMQNHQEYNINKQNEIMRNHDQFSQQQYDNNLNNQQIQQEIQDNFNTNQQLIDLQQFGNIQQEIKYQKQTENQKSQSFYLDKSKIKNLRPLQQGQNQYDISQNNQKQNKIQSFNQNSEKLKISSHKTAFTNFTNKEINNINECFNFDTLKVYLDKVNIDSQNQSSIMYFLYEFLIKLQNQIESDNKEELFNTFQLESKHSLKNDNHKKIKADQIQQTSFYNQKNHYQAIRIKQKKNQKNCNQTEFPKSLDNNNPFSKFNFLSHDQQKEKQGILKDKNFLQSFQGQNQQYPKKKYLDFSSLIRTMTPNQRLNIFDDTKYLMFCKKKV